jgi:HD-like signal output (HDOD) protein/CheY-like chemotaxis protein
MKRILFVDDEPESLRPLSAPFAAAADWELVVAPSGEEGLRVMFKEAFDVVVSDLAMPGMDGGAFLTAVMQRYPSVVRILLSDEGDRETTLRLAGAAHRDLAKACDPRELLQTVEQALALRELLANEKLKRLVGQVLSLPSMPELYLDLLEELRREAPATDRIAAIISRDPGMCAKLLQLVNSAFFGLGRPMASSDEAVLYLGLDTIKALVLSLQFFALFEHVRIREFSFERLWKHSWAAGLLAKRIALREKSEAKTADQTFTAGLLHDAGKLVLATGIPDQYRLVLRQQLAQPQIPLCAVEHEVLGTTHAEVGAYLLALWGLPDPVIEAVALHHRPAAGGARSFGPLAAVHVANILEHLARAETKGTSPVDLDFLARLGLDDRLHAWRELAEQLCRYEAK